MISNCATDLICAYRRRSIRTRPKDALRIPGTILRIHRQLQITSLSVVFCGSALLSVCKGLSEDREALPPEIVNQLRAAISYRIVMSPHAGLERLDREIRTVQIRVGEVPDPRSYLEQLGWLYVAKARTSYDQGFYKLAEQCALALEIVEPKNPAALLLRGHVLISFHRFAEAEVIARELVRRRTLPFDYGLLGDALLEQGGVAAAVDAYQQMVDLRPDLQSYSRVAYTRWLKGDLDGDRNCSDGRWRCQLA